MASDTKHLEVTLETQVESVNLAEEMCLRVAEARQDRGHEAEPGAATNELPTRQALTLHGFLPDRRPFERTSAKDYSRSRGTTRSQLWLHTRFSPS